MLGEPLARDPLGPVDRRDVDYDRTMPAPEGRPIEKGDADADHRGGPGSRSQNPMRSQLVRLRRAAARTGSASP